MNRINSLFQQKQKDILSIYFTAGYPQLNDTASIIETLDKSGADLIEVGVPFSDPLADGPTIQQSGQIALENGISLSLIFEQLAGIRNKVGLPLILMGYLNTFLNFGMEKLCEKCYEVGVDGLIIPDLPVEEYQNEYLELFKKHRIGNILLITPQTASERIRIIDELTDSFIYMVSSSSTTGAKNNISAEQDKYFSRVKQMELRNPCLIGFGISNNETFAHACNFANGAIIGSAFVKALAGEGKLEQKVENFVKQVRDEA